MPAPAAPPALKPPKPAGPPKPAPPAPEPSALTSAPLPAPEQLEGLPPAGDISTFVPEPFSLDDKPEPKIVAPTVTPPKPAGDELTPEQIEARRAENNGLRTTLEERSKLLKEREEELGLTRAEKAALERERDAIRAEKEEATSRLKKWQEDQGKIDPMTDPRVIKIRDEFQSSLTSLDSDIAMEGGKGGKLKESIDGLMAKYKQIGTPESSGFEERRDDFNSVLSENFPNHEREIRALVRDGVKKDAELTGIFSEINQNGSKYKQEREKESYRTVLEKWNEKERQFFKPSADVEQNDPFNAEVICSKLFETNDDTKAGKKKVMDFVRQVVLPQAPLDPADLAKMSPDDQKRYLEGRQISRAKLQETVQSQFPIALASMMFLPGVYKRLIEAEKALAAARGLNPPPPNGENEEPGDGEATSIKDFKPSNPLLDGLK